VNDPSIARLHKVCNQLAVILIALNHKFIIGIICPFISCPWIPTILTLNVVEIMN
jgi:hypothetical protein